MYMVEKKEKNTTMWQSTFWWFVEILVEMI